MRSQQHRYHQHRHRRGIQQFDLFMESDNARRQRPDWDMLPPQTRQALTDLMARLILDHNEEERDLLPRETRHDV
jgi:hypothetical protein